MQLVTNQTPSYEKWIPDPQSPDDEIDCKICRYPLLENPDDNFAGTTPEVFGHRQNNALYHKVHRYCLERWIATNPNAISEQNTVLCPLGCNQQIECSLLDTPRESLQALKQEMYRNYQYGWIGLPLVGIAYGISAGLYTNNTSLKVAVCSTICGSMIPIASWDWKHVTLPILLDRYNGRPTMRADLLRDARLYGLLYGAVTVGAMAAAISFINLFSMFVSRKLSDHY